jgi:hypothetical protein
MKLPKLIQHLETKHSSLEHKLMEFFQRKLKRSTLEASYQVSLRIAKVCKLRTIAENIILPAALDMVKVVTGSEDAKIN